MISVLLAPLFFGLRGMLHDLINEVKFAVRTLSVVVKLIF